MLHLARAVVVGVGLVSPPGYLRAILLPKGVRETYPSAPPSADRGGYTLDVVQVPSVAHPKSNPAMLVPTVKRG